MARILGAILGALTLAVPARATLVVIVPSAGGLVVAADSRESILGTECDGLFKIVAPRRTAGTVVVVTGAGVFVKPPSENGSRPGQPQHVCAYLESAPRLLDINAVVSEFLDRSPVAVETISLEDVGAACVAAVRRFGKSHPDALKAYDGRDIFSVVIARYNAKSRISTLLNFVVRSDAATREIGFDRPVRTTITARDRRGVWAFGLTDYLTSQVYRGTGRKYLSEATRNFILEDRPVAEAQVAESVAVAADVIRAASRTAETVPAPSGIGGPVHVVLLGPKARPRVISNPPAAVPGRAGRETMNQ